MADHPSCGYCGETMSPTDAERREHRKTTRRTYCNRSCAAKARRDRPGPKPCKHCGEPFGHEFPRAKLEKRQFCSADCQYDYRRRDNVTLACDNCGEEIERTPKQVEEWDHHYCSKSCRLRHAPKRKTYTCPQCGDSFQDVPSHNRTYCSKECMAEAYQNRLKGENNPNYGNRYDGNWTMPAEIRARFSEERMREGNPRWSGGTDQNGMWRFQTYVHNWVSENLGDECLLCDSENVDAHHIVPRRCFDEVPKAHFRANLLPLCRECHLNADSKGHALLEDGRPREIPFADRLPEPILRQLETDGLVSRLPESLDYSPLGNVAEEVIPSDAFGITE